MTGLGQPTMEEEFVLGPDVTEFRIELLNIYDAAKLKSDPPLIREATWSATDADNLTLWFSRDSGDWLAVHQMSWHPDTEF